MMGVVYEAHDPTLHRLVALKVVHLALAASPRDQEGFERRFLSEARIAARLSHPGIVVVHDVGRDDGTGTLYIALERLFGETLSERLAKGGRLDWREALRITARVARALHYAHLQGVVHRDVKPANIMVLHSGEPKLMDFGLAKQQTGQELTRTGQYLGTPLFMSPEQVLGERLDGRSDVFSLGSVLYTLLTGKRAFSADNVPRIMARVAHYDPPLPSEVVTGLPPRVDDVVARALAKAPADRYPVAEQLAEDAEDLLAGLEPRRLAGWTRPARGEGTVVSARGEASALIDLGLEPVGGDEPTAPRTPPAPPPSPRPRARGGPLRSIAVVLLLSLIAVLYTSIFWPDRFVRLLEGLRSQPGAAPPPMSMPPRPERGLDASPAAAAAPPAEPRPERTGADSDEARPETPSEALPKLSDERPPEPEPAPIFAPSPGPALPTAAPSPRPSRKKSPPAPKPGQLAIRMEHHLKSGSVRIYLDGKLVAEDRLDGKVTTKVLFFALHKGVFQETLTVTPGRHEIRVRVAWEGKAKVRSISGTFKSGLTRRLDVSLGRIGGDLSLEWAR
jgi:serine/threonine-protein kinase